MKSIKCAIREYINYRCSLGFKLKDDKLILEKFSSFMTNLRATHVTDELAKAFAKLNPCASRVSWAIRLATIRRFAQYWVNVDALTEIPSQCFGSSTYTRRAPYIYSDDEIMKILKCCKKSSSAYEIERYTYFIWFGLIIVTGMRPGEIQRLDRHDLNLAEGIITIRNSKFNKSRHVPLHKSTVQVLKAYLTFCDRYISKPRTSRLFINHLGTQPSISTVRKIFRRILDEVGIPRTSDGRPRIMDFRHTFAVKTLIRWYERHINIDQYIPLLSTYLGHTHFRHTYWYITMTPECLKYIALRLKSSERRLT